MRLSDDILIQQIDRPDGTFSYVLISESHGTEIELGAVELGRLMMACMFFQVQDATLSQEYRNSMELLFGNPNNRST